MKKTRHAADPEWKQLMRLGEQLSAQHLPSAQCHLLEETVSRLLLAQTRVWLAEPIYPLPNYPNDPILDLHQATQLAQQAASQRCLQVITLPDDNAKTDRSKNHSAAAVPLAANGNLLGVLQVDRAENDPLIQRDLDLLEGLVAHAAIAMEITRQEQLKNWRFQQINLVRSVSAQIANIRNPSELYPQVTHLIQQTFNFYYAAIFTLNENQNQLIFRADAGKKQEEVFLPGAAIQMAEGLVGIVGQTGKEIIAPDVLQNHHYRTMDALPETQAEATLPLTVENRLVGVLDVQSNHPHAFHEIDMLVLHTLADTIALAIENAHLYYDLHHRAEHISSVFEVSHALGSILDLDELLNEVARLIHRRFGYPSVHVFTVHPGRRKIIYEAGTGERSEAMRKDRLSYPLDSEIGIIPWAARNGQTFVAHDVLNEPLYRPNDILPDETRSEIAVPLMIGQEVLGILDIQSKEPHAFDENDQSLFEALAATIATAIRNANLYRSEQWRRRVAESFRDVTYLITTNQPLDQLMDILLEKLESNLPCDASAIWLLEEDPNPANEKRTVLRLAATRNIRPELILQAIREDPAPQLMLDRAMEADQPLIRKPEDPMGPLGAALGFNPNYSSIAAPMRSSRRSLGMITLAHASEGRYGSEAQAITATFANYAAVALQNGQLYRETQEQALISAMLLQVAEASQSILTVDDLLSTMVRLTRLLMGVRKCAFLLWEDSLQLYELKAWYGFDPISNTNEAGTFYPANLPALTRLAEEKNTLYLDNPLDELNMPEISLAPENGTLIMLPLLVRGELIGAFLVALRYATQPTQEQGFDPKAVGILQGISQQTAMTVDNLRLLEARQEEAYVTAALLQVAEAVVSSTDLHDTLDTIVHLLPILVGIDACIIYLWDPSSRLFRPIQAFANSRREEEIILSTVYAPGENKVLDAVFQEGSLHLCKVENPAMSMSDYASLDNLPYSEVASQSPPTTGNWLLVYPLSLQGLVMGMMVIQEKNTSPSFWERRMEIINGITQQVSLAIQNDLYKQELVGNERIEREVQLARQIQETFLPASMPHLNGWEIDLRWEPAREVGGDFYDVFRLDGNRLGLVIADVSDKGLPAALYMTVTRTLIHAFAAGGDDPASVLQEVNELLLNDSPESMFVTGVYAIISLDSGELVFANAGHNLPLIYRASASQVEQTLKGGTALGVLEHLKLENHVVQIQPGDVLTLFTDGVVDILSPQNESFGDTRLRLIIEEYGKEGVDAMLENLDDALTDFRQGTRPFDDVTLVAIRRN